MKPTKLIILLLSVFLIGYTLTVVTYTALNKPIDIQRIPIDVEVGYTVGINVDTDAFHFGRTSPGGSAWREFNIKNEKDYVQEVLIRFEGDVAYWMKPSLNNFTFGPGQTKKITLTVNVPENAEVGNYTGEAVFIFKKA